ncbi:MAG: hypothetical protein ACK4ZW_09865 [Blastomonas sp.]
MNAITQITAAQDGQRKAAATLLWNQQRGKLIDAFTRSEFAVTQTLQFLASIEARGADIKINPNLQGRFTQLLKLFASAGAFAPEGKTISAPLQAMSDSICLRNMLCHGRTTMYHDDAGRWIVQLELLTVIKARAEPRETLLTQDQVKRTLKELTTLSADTVCRLDELRKNLAAAKSITPSAPAAQASR